MYCIQILFVWRLDKVKNRIVIGAGRYNNNPGWLHTEEAELSLLKSEKWEKRFILESLDAILAEHVWEHLSYKEGLTAAKECYRYLKKGGYIRCAVPDGFFPNKAYQHVVQVGGPGPVNHICAGHKVLFTYHSLKAMFSEAGFLVDLLEYHDETGVFHENNWNGEDGIIFRSKRYDPRNQGESIVFASLIIDAIKK
nr:methyltransferase domain-containing protein [Shouchella patagoniensis]